MVLGLGHTLQSDSERKVEKVRAGHGCMGGICAYALLLSMVPLVAFGALVGVAEANLAVSLVPVITDDLRGFGEPAGASDIDIAEISGRMYAVVAWPDTVS